MGKWVERLEGLGKFKKISFHLFLISIKYEHKKKILITLATTTENAKTKNRIAEFGI